MVRCECGTNLASCKVNFPAVAWESFPVTVIEFFAIIEITCMCYTRALFHGIEGNEAQNVFWQLSFLPLSIPLVSLPYICPLGLSQFRINISNQLCLYGNSCRC